MINQESSRYFQFVIAESGFEYKCKLYLWNYMLNVLSTILCIGLFQEDGNCIWQGSQKSQTRLSDHFTSRIHVKYPNSLSVGL